MIIKTLVENTTASDELGAEHGLSLYIETKNHRLLFDLGASELFIENAKKMGVDLSAVDMVIISHGHYDHGGGLKAFWNVNLKAKIYMHHNAFDKHYANKPSGEKVYIGLNEGLVQNDRFIFVRDYMIIDDELELFSNVKGMRFNPSGNQDLLMESDTLLVQDDFAHEQNLIINEDGKTLLIAGCAHNGIVNILDHLYNLKNGFPSYVIGGFHLYNRSRNKFEEPSLVSQIGEYLNNTGAECYTCHCTGIEPYKNLKDIMEEKIQYLATGITITI